ncbi:sugar transporter [Methylocucumis oryzae]|uniref:Sugar transporter n=1 Tax=Methylocucumis oryzae TaxID=1632867 RepID=A0A0F3IH07_9GAMM|nr:sugar transporter [Methylocucumis oryzae]
MRTHKNRLLSTLIILLGLLNTHSIFADTSLYSINPGDTLEISVWNEDALKRELKVLPDGTISFPLAGVLSTTGKTVNDIQKQLKEKLSVYIEDPVVNVAVRAVEGNSVFVMGQVNKPGSFVMYQPLNITQILGLAGGFTTFAKTGSVLILRSENNKTKAIKFDYNDVEDGEGLESNIRLQSGDVVIVP